MTTGTPVEPDQESPQDVPAAAPARRGPLQILIIALLILVPSGYGAIAAMQSRDSDGEKLIRAEIAGLVPGWPSRMQRSVYQVPIPYNATRVGYFEANSWQDSSLYAQFTTTGGGLDSFLAQLGTSRAALTEGRITVTPTESTRVDWDFSAGHHWAGLLLTKRGSTPDHRITVNLDNPDRPSVFVVSTTDFR